MTTQINFNPEERAGWEEIWRREDIPPRFRSFAPPNETVVAWAKTVPPGGFVLDVGCGVGRHVIYLGECGFRVAGVDISPTGIRLTQDAAAERQLSFDGHVSNMTTLPWADMSFDGVLSTSTIHHHLRTGIVQALSEIKRVLKPGGLLLVDFPCTDTIVYQQLRDLVARGQIDEVEPNTFVDERDEEDPDGFLPHHFCDEVDVRDLLNGFEMIKLWPDLREAVTERGSGLVGKWVAWARRSISD